MSVHDPLEAEQARYIHRTVPTAAAGSLLTSGLVAAVVHDAVSASALYLWFSGFIVLTVVRLSIWRRYRHSDFSLDGGAWLRQAMLAAFVSGALWGSGSLFIFPPGQLGYQLTFMSALEMMAVAGMFSYSAHYPTFLAFFLPSMPPGIVGLALQEGPTQRALRTGIVLMIFAMLFSMRLFYRMILESLRLRFENVELVAQLTVQKDAAESANLAKSRFLAAASHDLRQPIHALNLYLGAFAQLELPRPASAAARQGAPVRADHGRDVPRAARHLEARRRRRPAADRRLSAGAAASRARAGVRAAGARERPRAARRCAARHS